MAVHMPETPQALHGEVGEDYNIRTILSVAIIGFLTLILAVVWLKAIWARAERWEFERKVIAAPFGDLRDYRAKQAEKLQTYDWTDPATDKVSIPLQIAAGQALSKLQQDQQAFEAQTRSSAVAAQPPAAAEAASPVVSAAPATAEPAAGTPAAAVPAADSTKATTIPAQPSGATGSATAATPAAPAGAAEPAGKGQRHHAHPASQHHSGQHN